jgi:hypothetical protein
MQSLISLRDLTVPRRMSEFRRVVRLGTSRSEPLHPSLRPQLAEADALISEVMRERGYPVSEDFQQRAADVSVDHPVVGEHSAGVGEGFAQARDGLEGQWSRGEDVGTEELRVALQRYRGFFRRLLSA